MKLILSALTLASIAAHATDAPTYLVLVKEERDGKEVQSASVVIQESAKGDIKSTLADNTGLYFEVFVFPGKSGKLSVDYRFKDTTQKQTLEIAKTAVALNSGTTETTNLKDSGGNDVALKVTVTKLNQQPQGADNVKQSFRLRE